MPSKPRASLWLSFCTWYVATQTWDSSKDTRHQPRACACNFPACQVGARPVQEGTGRIARFELIPLEAMDGRPRVDVLCNMSGIFRDSFQVLWRNVLWMSLWRNVSRPSQSLIRTTRPLLGAEFFGLLQNVVELLDDLFRRAAQVMHSRFYWGG